jgi:hypothetical protein
MTTDATLQISLKSQGFALVEATGVRRALSATGALADWDAFAATWNDLAVDGFMADGGRYRRRRHARASASGTDPIHRLPHGPHYQGLDYNHLNGGVERWFEPVTEAAWRTHSLDTILRFCRALFEAVSAHRRWLIELHQFRIEASQDISGQPTPEGVHRDGVDYVLVLMIKRENIASGVTTIAGPDATPLGTFTLSTPLDAAFIDDHRVHHGVTPVVAVDPAKPAFRDVLVVTFKAVR